MYFVIVLIVKVVVIRKIPKLKVGIGVQYIFNLYEKILINKRTILNRQLIYGCDTKYLAFKITLGIEMNVFCL